MLMFEDDLVLMAKNAEVKEYIFFFFLQSMSQEMVENASSKEYVEISGKQMEQVHKFLFTWDVW